MRSLVCILLPLLLRVLLRLPHKVQLPLQVCSPLSSSSASQLQLRCKAGGLVGQLLPLLLSLLLCPANRLHLPFQLSGAPRQAISLANDATQLLLQPTGLHSKHVHAGMRCRAHNASRQSVGQPTGRRQDGN